MSFLIKSADYLKREARFLKRHSNLCATYEKTLYLLELNKNHPSLRLHLVPSAKRKDRYAISINLQYRITLFFAIDGGNIHLLDVGDHDIY